jgi:putative addiction module killer protein
MSKQIRLYKTANGLVPFEQWLENLKDVNGRAKVRVRIKRVVLGNLGDYRSVGSGIIELRINYGPSYRVYAGLFGREIIVLLCGGDKGSQDKDISKAREYWEDYLRRL